MILFINPQILVQVLKIDKQRLEWRILLKVNHTFPAKLDKNFFSNTSRKRHPILFSRKLHFSTIMINRNVVSDNPLMNTEERNILCKNP